MATLSTTTTPTAKAAQPPGLALDFIPYIDMTTLSQSELRALSLCSTSSSSSSSDVVIPTIDHSIFNESSGSRRQTYSRPSHHHHHRHRLAALLPKTPSASPPSSASNDPSTEPDRLQNHSIISFLKQLLSSHPQFQQSDFLEFDSFSYFHQPIYATSLPPPPVPPQQQGNFAVAAMEGRKRKRKRGRKPKVKLMSAEERERAMGSEIVNKNGVVVDLMWLASLEDPYKEELKRRTEGMEKEEELLGFFRDLGGEWCSRRKKRKIVDASEFGDTLPVGWKLLLGLKRKEGRAWVYCRRYIRCLYFYFYFVFYVSFSLVSNVMKGNMKVKLVSVLSN